MTSGGTLNEDNYALVSEFVRQNGGRRVLSKVLIANNGIAALKSIRSLRRWSFETFGNVGALQFVAMATPEDIRANAEYIRMADELVEVPGGTNNHNYANVSLIVEIAERHQANAIWPGWGHASENPELPDLISETRGLTWIGPGAQSMRALGDKISSTLIAQAAGVPCVAWSGSDVNISYSRHEGISPEDYSRACVSTVEEAVESTKKIGFPVMIKASEGGGGKGIRMVAKMDDVEDAFRAVRSEVPGSPIFMMKMASNCRHLEVQLIADEWGQAIAIYGRDCSIQRRHQKIIEEGPVVAATSDCWRILEQSAIRLAKEVGYVGAGTVEYLYTEDGNCYFLELNPRLQVEHTVSELLSNVNLPALQVQVAMGIPLHHIPEVRVLFGADPTERSRIDFDNTPMRPPTVHVIAVRITAENPEKDFQPTSGSLQDLNFRCAPNVWGYFSIDSHGGVHEFADSQFGHVFAVGSDREAARRSMCVALSELCIRGEIRTTVEFLRTILDTEDFKMNRIHTRWLEEVPKSSVQKARPPVRTVILLSAAYCATIESRERMETFRSRLAKGQMVLNAAHKPLMLYNVSLVYEDVKYVVNVSKAGGDERACISVFDLEVNGSSVLVEVRRMADEGFLISLDGLSHSVYGHEDGTSLRVIIDGNSCIFSQEQDPSKLLSQLSGRLVRYTVEDGEHVSRGQNIAEMEVMKMYIAVPSSGDGIIHFIRSPGSVVENGDLLATLDLDSPDEVQKTADFTGTFEANVDSPNLKSQRPLCDVFNESWQRLVSVMDGYKLRRDSTKEALTSLLGALRDPRLPLAEVNSVLSTLAGRLPESVYARFQDILESYSQLADRSRFFWEAPHTFPVGELIDVLDQACTEGNTSEEMRSNSQPLRAVLQRHLEGNHVLAVRSILDLINRYLEVERRFSTNCSREFVVQRIRQESKNDLDTVARVAMAHAQIEDRNALILDVLDVIQKDLSPLLDMFVPVLKDLCVLHDGGSRYEKVVMKSRKLLVRYRLPSFEERRATVLTLLATSSHADGDERLIRLTPLIDKGQDIVDVLFDVISTSSTPAIHRLAAFEVYVRRLYRAFDIRVLQISRLNDLDLLVARFTFVPSKNLQRPALHRIDSLASLSESRPSTPTGFHPDRVGLVIWSRSFTSVKRHFPGVLGMMGSSPSTSPYSEPLHCLHLCIEASRELETCSDEELSQMVEALVDTHAIDAESCGIRRVTFAIAQSSPSQYPRLFTLRSRLLFREDKLIRHLEPTLAAHLELCRLSKFPSVNSLHTTHRMIRLFEVTSRDGSRPSRRLFARSLVRVVLGADVASGRGIVIESEQALVESLHSLEEAMTSDDARNNHIFLSVLAYCEHGLASVVQVIELLFHRYVDTIRRLHVTEVELRLRVEKVGVLRLVCSNPTGFVLRLHCYLEALDPDTGSMVYSFIPSHMYAEGKEGASCVGDQLPEEKGPFDGLEVLSPYGPSPIFQGKRDIAERLDTIYCYDFLSLMEHAAAQTWNVSSLACSHRVLEAVEIVFAEDTVESDELERGPNANMPTLSTEEVQCLASEGLKITRRAVGQNTIGMVAWRALIRTPSCPDGRPFVLIANDITYQAGTFGVLEDRLFFRVSRYARRLGFARLYLAANSGARIGLATEVEQRLQVEWIDDRDVLKGFQYLFLNEADYMELRDVVDAEEIQVGEGKRYVLNGILGRKCGLGVENLQGSGQIAGETAAAYDESFTLSYVSTRSVGIGAYLVRLGQRLIQKEGSAAPILLTGYGALNKILGSPVYTSNRQLGGTEIMAPNGVTHLTVKDDLHACEAIVRWLDYLPVLGPNLRIPLLPAVSSCVDPIDRDVSVEVPGTPHDPRMLLTGLPENDWTGGLLDKGSYQETLAEWARSVICGRGKIGGMPVAVISVETRTMEKVIPADPANEHSQEEVVQQAGQIWYPDSAFKTAQCIADFNGEGLPLVILASWRGFPGGQREMFNEVLKYGSMIVEELRRYRQPIIVYLPPKSELRGGAWVVVDRTINPDFMESYADPDSRGGVMEPAGSVAIRFKKQNLSRLAHRVDPEIRDLLSRQDGKEVSSEAIRTREKHVQPALLQVATGFADLHDRPYRMLATGVINGIVEWKNARKFLYWRLRRRWMESCLELAIGRDALIRYLDLCPNDFSTTSMSVHDLWLQFALSQAAKSSESFRSALMGHDDDMTVVSWLEGNLERFVGVVNAASRQDALNRAVDACTQVHVSEISAVVDDVVNALSRWGGPALEMIRQRLDPGHVSAKKPEEESTPSTCVGESGVAM